MPNKFKEIAFTWDSVRKAQADQYGHAQFTPHPGENDALTDDEIHFNQGPRQLLHGHRQRIRLALHSASGRANPGFLRVISPTQLAFADYQGKLPVALHGQLSPPTTASHFFLMDYPATDPPQPSSVTRALEDARATSRARERIRRTPKFKRVVRMHLLRQRGFLRLELPPIHHPGATPPPGNRKSHRPPPPTHRVISNQNLKNKILTSSGVATLRVANRSKPNSKRKS